MTRFVLKKKELNTKYRKGTYYYLYDKKTQKASYYQVDKGRKKAVNQFSQRVSGVDYDLSPESEEDYITFLRKQEKERADIIEKEIGEKTNFHVMSQSSMDTRGKGYNTRFKYLVEGVFEEIPSKEKLSVMIKNSLISAYNNGQRNKGQYLPRDVYESLTQTHLDNFDTAIGGGSVPELVKGMVRGVEIRKTTERASNQLSAELIIVNNGRKWRGHN